MDVLITKLSYEQKRWTDLKDVHRRKKKQTVPNVTESRKRRRIIIRNPSTTIVSEDRRFGKHIASVERQVNPLKMRRLAKPLIESTSEFLAFPSDFSRTWNGNRQSLTPIGSRNSYVT